MSPGDMWFVGIFLAVVFTVVGCIVWSFEAQSRKWKREEVERLEKEKRKEEERIRELGTVAYWKKKRLQAQKEVFEADGQIRLIEEMGEPEEEPRREAREEPEEPPMRPRR